MRKSKSKITEIEETICTENAVLVERMLLDAALNHQHLIISTVHNRQFSEESVVVKEWKVLMLSLVVVGVVSFVLLLLLLLFRLLLVLFRLVCSTLYMRVLDVVTPFKNCLYAQTQSSVAYQVYLYKHCYQANFTYISGPSFSAVTVAATVMYSVFKLQSRYQALLSRPASG